MVQSLYKADCALFFQFVPLYHFFSDDDHVVDDDSDRPVLRLYFLSLLFSFLLQVFVASGSPLLFYV